MSPRAPAEQPAPGETIQERNLDQQQAQLAEEQTTAKRETWADWMPSTDDALITEEELLQHLNRRNHHQVNREDLRAWHDQGVLPAPIAGEAGPRYPYTASVAIQATVLRDREANGNLDPEELRAWVRDVAESLDKSEAKTRPWETWRDWLGDEPEPDELFTREEIVKRANALISPNQDPVKATDLQRWEKLGILPRPIRRRHGNAQYALYPDWQAYLVRHVRRLQSEGYSLDEIRPRVRTHARMMLGYGRTAIDDEIGRLVDSPEEVALWPTLVEDLERLARWWSHLQGADVDRIEVHVIGTNGRRTEYPLPIGPPVEHT